VAGQASARASAETAASSPLRQRGRQVALGSGGVDDADRQCSAPEPKPLLVNVGGDGPDRKHATFRLVGERLDPEAITRATGVTPDRTIRKGDPVLSGGEVVSHRRLGVWWIDSARQLSPTDNHVEDHVVWLLDLLEPLADVLRRLADEQGLRADIGCGYSTSRWNSSFGFSAETLGRIAKLGASLGFDIYANELAPDLDTA
jgi:hypothetical protein